MRSADKFTIEKLGIGEQTLIERAGNVVATEIINRLRGGRVLVCIGKGKNGEDGKVIASILSKVHGFTVATLNVYNGIFKMFDKKFDIIVDCIFGTGLNREVEGKYREAIEKINGSGAYVVSCDIPSGLNSDTGEIMGVCVKADLTVAIQELKLGHFLGEGKDCCGTVVAKDIGISIWGDDYAKRLNKEDCAKYFPERKNNVNKGNFGKVAVVGGSKNYVGSALLSANALVALKMGTGYSYLFVPESLFPVYAGKNPEIIVNTLPDKDGNFVFDEESMKKLLPFNTVCIGMGIGKSEQVYKMIAYLLENFTGKLVIDADGLNSLSEYGVDILLNKKCQIVLTPHIGEFSRLIKTDKVKIIKNPIEFAKDFAEKYKIVLLLKSAVSVITDGDNVYINTNGNSGLSKAGSGDVLDGILGGILNRSSDVLEGTAVSSFIFGLSGDIAKKEQNEYTITASDVIGALPKTINSL